MSERYRTMESSIRHEAGLPLHTPGRAVGVGIVNRIGAWPRKKVILAASVFGIALIVVLCVVLTLKDATGEKRRIG